MSVNTKTWITSDLHFGDDDRLIERFNRPCSKETHIDYLIATLNGYIGENDYVYHNGDFTKKRDIPLTFGQIKDIISRLNGIWHFIIGNNDDADELRCLCEGTRHEVLGLIYELEHNGETIVLCHYPIEFWHGMERGTYHFYGHTHSRDMMAIKNRFNVCFDREFKPYLINDLLACKFNKSIQDFEI